MTTQKGRDTSARGDIAEIHVAAALMRAGRRVLRPMSSASRYDLLIDNGDGSFVRVQCKNGVLKNGSIVFRVYSVSGHHTKSVPYGDQVDAFGVYSPDTNMTYLVPVSAISGRTGMVCLRVRPARNGQRRRINPAPDYAIGE